MISDAKAAGQTPAFENIDPGYTGEMLAEARNTISVDVGEGTVNFPVFRDVGGNGMISIESSASIINIAHACVAALGPVDVIAISALEAQHPGFLQTILDRSRQDIDKMIAQAKTSGQTPAFENIDPGYTGEMLAEARNTISVDVGEGTVNFPVFRDVGGNGMISIESSASINSGYGTALQRVCDKLANSDIAFESRKSLADFMLHEPKTPAAKRMHEAVRRVLDPEIQVLCGDILRRYTQIFSQVGIRTDVIYVS